ncbi:AbrB/MazE/SpoVT family DNA-binding domain-containing protein [Lactobacillus acidophilus]|uniref:AbrB/MazE/SpoVT family DNA-binding domain-containing protein n=1 Tax=Lactobacillus acidophilus TaxID=1579 RepID=UPI002889A54B|nr:AbrB/MazE/SpoVT family DNA-binding domain-containing protein [Lactobacillus acidophilus]MCT3602299.1 AbrB/MazE/SpoVT family DNA-binding domain-containing protein [Lactobacillus acidophilus]MCT3624544.1 AbrB/MazE/SpoVT family DNA-binding domain-containing protein [Lactobacillus acidophilus]
MLPTKFDIEVNKDNEIVLKKQKKPESLKELFDGFDYKKYWSDWEKEHPNQSKEIDSDEPVGRELF